MNKELNTAQRYALLLSKYELLVKVFEEVLVYVFATCEMRDLYRRKAGLPTKCEDDNESK